MPADHSAHRKRIKEQCLQSGLKSFPAHNKLEILLFHSIPRKDTNPVAHALIERFGSLSAVFDAPYGELLKVPEIGEASAFLIKLIPQLAAAYMEDKTGGKTVILDSPEKAGKFLIPKFLGKTNECVFAAALDSQKRLLSCQQVFEGGISSVDISVRKIAELCLRVSAVSVIVAHNHPNGIAVPSKEDLYSSGRITLALEMLGVEVVDHMIVVDDDYCALGTCRQFAQSVWGGDFSF
ncbi:MAG: hypothetical protein LBC56_01280 [Oscillospiraceae bacterium]|jgi:DNA repair protein RadC|nr:hypothetical protein [Oscillospiraceae bacterium]